MDLLRLDVGTGFVHDADGRMLYDNAPDRGAAPRLHLAGCAEGNVLQLRSDVPEQTTRAIEQLAADEPPLDQTDSTPVHLDDYLRLLAADAPVQDWQPGLSWVFPERLTYTHSAPLVGSDSPEGTALVARLQRDGMPRELAELGFVDTGEFWHPWCVALHDGQIASIAFAARLGPHAAATGVVTVPRFRGQGYAAAATVG